MKMKVDESKEINIAISGWPGSGSTSYGYILALLLKRKYLYMGDIFRYLGENLGHQITGKSQVDFDDYIEDIIGNTVDNYIDHKLLNENNLFLDADIAAFRLGKNPKIFSVFIKASYEERLRRVVKDGRVGGETFLKSRGEVLAQKYKELWDVDFFSEESIALKYNLVIDNSNMTIENELKITIDALNKYHKFENTFDLKEMYEKIDKEVEDYQKDGKDDYKRKLISKHLYVAPQEILREITQEFPEDVAKFPEEVQKLFIGI
jgi:cytidylate kinase